MNMKWLLAMLLVISPLLASACEKGQVVYRSDCINEKDVPKTVAEELKYYGKIVAKVGEHADLYSPKAEVYANAALKGKPVLALTPPGIPFNLENQAWTLYKVKITAVLKEAYQVSVDVYDNAPVCGNTGKIIKHVKGYVPKVDAQGLPSLWQFERFTGLC